MKSRRSFLLKALFASPIMVWPNVVSAFLRNDLPDVLILGDSISIGYTPFVQKFLNGKANVFRPVLEDGKPENCQGTTNGIANIDRWIGNRKWDVIHFNFGLHDLKHVDPDTGVNSQNPKHPQQASLKQYKKNLEIITEKLLATDAKLIFATTTPYPDVVNGPLRKPGMPKKYNRVAVKIMNKKGILINNLHDFILPRMADLQLPANVHFTEEGSRAMALKVVDRINEALDNEL